MPVKPFLLAALTGVMFGFLVATSPAKTEAETSTGEVPAADLKELTDPTILTRRVWLEQEWNHFEDGANVVENTLGTLWAWRFSEHQDWAVRLKVPVTYRVGSDTPGVPDIGGLGDVKVATGTAFRL